MRLIRLERTQKLHLLREFQANERERELLRQEREHVREERRAQQDREIMNTPLEGKSPNSKFF